MCGRYALACSYELLMTHFGVFDHICFKSRYNIAPQQTILTILPGRRLQFMHWGFRPAWGKPDSPEYMNARLETILEKPAFKHAFLKKRCLIPATGYYEWQQTPRYKQPYYLRVKESPLFAFAGVWSLASDPDFGGVRETVTLLTKAAGPALASRYETQPVIITELNYHAWLSGENLTLLQSNILVQEDNWGYYPVTRKVNHPTFDVVECVSPIGIDS